MTQLTQNHNILAAVLQFFGGLQSPAFRRKFSPSGLLSFGNQNAELSAHLRHDIGEDDYRPAAVQPLLQQEAARTGSLASMLLRSF